MVVVRLVAREQIALDTHQGMGHFGVQRVLDRLQKNKRWRVMGDAMVAVLKVCLSCARVQTSFRESGKELLPLPIKGFEYKWGVDFASPLLKTSAGNEWVMVCIEHFTKWVELFPLPSKSSRDSARGFLEGVLSRYGAPTRALTDKGSKFMFHLLEFHLLFGQHEITHALVSREHP